MCRDRKAALSPNSVEGEHDHGGTLGPALIDEVHRVTSDPARLTVPWYRSLLDRGLTTEAYVEALGVTVIVISIDQFHRALGLAPEALPTPIAGEPTRKRPEGIVEGEVVRNEMSEQVKNISPAIARPTFETILTILLGWERMKRWI